VPTLAIHALAMLEELRKDGLPVRSTVIYTQLTDPDGLLGTTDGPAEKVAFVDARINAGRVHDRSYGSLELGGTIEVYDDARTATAMAAQAAARPGSGRVVTWDGVLLVLSQHLTKLQADGYVVPITYRDDIDTSFPRLQRYEQVNPVLDVS